ncbi:hypothetical protein AAV96_06690 [Acinetobacter sp. AG1]|uniref:DUF262 domain-containing protein n=1 Tax=Acinetobacter sp. AG1 TaxID=348388 RepID=UPI000629AE10|nr:DUF262 domain-containing protein [Acinetobacter sp. AG1]KKW79942.1 hypothetical protein AAV96_06690 [Acinetobacter sp. AG1]
MADISIRDILNQIGKGNLRIPSFQRGFVWDADSVAFLMDSIYKGYPFGTIQLWRTREKLETEKQFGPFQLFDRDAEYPIDYVLDGQQRITSIFGVFQTEIESDDTDNPFKIYYDLHADENSQDSQFVALLDSDVIQQRHFPLNCLFDTVKYRKATKNLEEEIVEKIDLLQSIFKEVKIPFQTLETDDKTKVAIVFERINRKGVPLDTLQLLTAWTWSENFDLQDKFYALKDELHPMGFDELGENSDLLLKICSAVLTHDTSSKSLIELNGNTVRARFEEVLNGIKGSIDFLKKNLKIEKLSNMPYEHYLMPLTVFFSNTGNQHFNYTYEQKKTLISWFWKTAFSKRYHSATTNTINRDIQEVIKLKNNDVSCKLSQISCEIHADFFFNNKFTMNTVVTKTFILLLAQNSPKSFLSGSNISLSNVLKDYNKNEFHHIYPKAFMGKVSEENKKYDVNCLANFCMLSRADNKKIDCLSPSEYRQNLMPRDANEIFSSNFISEKILIEDDFNGFIVDRAEKLRSYTVNLINTL